MMTVPPVHLPDSVTESCERSKKSRGGMFVALAFFVSTMAAMAMLVLASFVMVDVRSIKASAVVQDTIIMQNHQGIALNAQRMDAVAAEHKQILEALVEQTAAIRLLQAQITEQTKR